MSAPVNVAALSLDSPCPENDRWQAFLDDAVLPEQRERFERHLEACPACQERLDRSLPPDDALVRLVRERDSLAVSSPDPTLSRLLERLHGEPSPLRGTPHEASELYFLQPCDRPDLLGTLGNYEVREVIGEGGMGVVLKAYEPALQRLVAIKVLAPALAGSATARRRFTREAQAAAAVCHDHVVALHGVHEADGLPYLVMQYVAGESLQARLDRTGPLEVMEVVRIGLQTASGLAAAHAQGLIHRDIKPANLLLENGLARVKITDFGLARMIDDVHLTQNGVVTGTPEYMAPEQARGEVVDPRADLFSLGSVLYAMCTGVAPFRGATTLAVLRQVNDAEPTPIRTLHPEVPVPLEAIIVRLMAKDPAQRFQSASEVATLLESYLTHLCRPGANPPPKVPPAPGGRPSHNTPHRKRRFGVLLGVGAAILCLVLACLELSRWFQVAAPVRVRAPRSEFYQDFRGNAALPSYLQMSGVEESVVEREPAGLRVRMPANRCSDYPAGVVLSGAFKGDFEVTVSFDLLSDKPPSTGQGIGIELYLMTETPGQTSPHRDALAVSRLNRPAGGERYMCNRAETVDGKRRFMTHTAPVGTAPGPVSKSGRLRLTRTGGKVTAWAAEGPNGDFREVGAFDHGTADLQMVRFSAYPGGTRVEPVEVRLVDLRIGSESRLPTTAETTGSSDVSAGSKDQKQLGISRPWLRAVALCGLIVTLGLLTIGVWVWFRRPGRPTATERSEPETGAQPEPDASDDPVRQIAFPCSGCGKIITVRPELAGRKGRCRHCGQGIMVPMVRDGEDE
jgi:serine/threonine protein kinase